MFISHLKLKVLEMSTGRNKVEEWNFLPTNWDHALHDALCDKNFFILDFGTSGKFEFTDTDDILILNMVTRKKFWMRSGTLRTQVEEKAAGRIDLVERFGRREVYYNLRPERSGYFLPKEIFRLVRLVSHSVI